MEFIKDEHGNFVLICDDAGLAMTRQEAEELFVMIGHALQDDDVERFSNEQYNRIQTEED